MNTYEEKNWKKELPFNNDIYRSVKHFSFLHGSAERKILDAEIAFYRKHYSLEQLLNAFKLCKSADIAHFKEVVSKRKYDIMYCPKCLQGHYYNRIKTEFYEHSEFLLDMLTVATKQPCIKNPCMPLYKLVLGGLFTPVKRKIIKYSKRKIVETADVKIQPTKYVSYAQEIIESLKKDYLAHGIFGDMATQDIVINKHLGQGRGHLNSMHFYVGNADLYTISTNENTLKLEALRHDIYANIYPGRAHLFNSILPKSNKNFDCGATFFLNGWDTFTAWHYKPSGYTRNYKTVYSKICSFLLKGNYKHSLEELNRYLLSMFPADQAHQILITITQYAGLFESYVMGGLATELLIEKGFASSPVDLLNKYKKVDCGDFFGLYLQKANKNKKLLQN